MPSKMPICKPLLPLATDLLPWLSQIDDSRTYSNNGPLLQKFENAFCSNTQNAFYIVGQANGTLAIQTAILAKTGMAQANKKVCLLPAFTFSASVSAVIAAGYQPHFVDVDHTTMMLDPIALRNHSELENVGLVLVIAAFGALPALKSWAEFEHDTGIAVVIDGAACTDAFLSGAQKCTKGLPLSLSFHATKPFGIGEGGAIISDDADYITRVRQCSNFGFSSGRTSDLIGTNSKMSEYQAAMGLALMQKWPDMQAQMMTLVRAYHARFKGDERFIMEREWVTPYPHILARNNTEHHQITRRLDDANIDHRQWWQSGCHTHTAYQEFPCDLVSVTDDLARRLVGLPFFPDMSIDQIDQVAQTIQHD